MSGPFFFAWVDAADFMWDAYGSFARSDEEIVSFKCTHDEGDFATLEIGIRNPRIGLLHAGRKQWAWLSWDRAWQPLPPQQVGDPPVVDEHVPDYVPLFFGRIVGVPSNINQEIVTLQFTARPFDFYAQKIALAESLKTRPYYDPIFINPANINDPDTVLEARSALWHIDRVTGLVTISDTLAGEDGIAAFAQDEVPSDSVEINITQPPLRRVTMDAKINWSQAATGVIDFGTRTFETYTGGSILQDWPKTGTSLQAGWSVEAASAVDVWRVEKSFTTSFSSSWSSTAEKHSTGDTISASNSSTTPVLEGMGEPYIRQLVTGETYTGVGKASSNVTYMYVLKYLMRTSLQLRYNASRARAERVRFTLENNIQSLITDPGDEETLVLDISSVDVGLPLPDSSIPIGSTERAHYITTDRGAQSLEYLIALARANLLQRSRAVDVKFTCLFSRAIELSCRMNASLEDPRLPGGSAFGKIKEYTFSCDGPSGEILGTVTIGCSIGYGGTVEPVEGDPLYCDTDYCEDDYQEFENRVDVLAGGDVGYSIPIDGVVDDGLRFPLTKDQVVVKEVWHGSIEEQETVIRAALPIETQLANSPQPTTINEAEARDLLQARTVSEVMRDHSIWYELELKPLTGKFDVEYNIQVTQLEVPQSINLEAGA